MIAKQLAAQIASVVARAHDGGLSDEEIADALQDAVNALRELQFYGHSTTLNSASGKRPITAFFAK